MSDTLGIYASRLRERRQAAGFTQAEAGRAVGISQSQLANLETGWSKPPAVELAAQLAHAYSTSADYLLGLSDDPRPVVHGNDWPPVADAVIRLLSELSPRAQDGAAAILTAYVDQERKRAEEADKDRQQRMQENRLFLDIVEGAGEQAVDALIDVLRATRDQTARKRLLTEWAERNLPAHNQSSEP